MTAKKLIRKLHLWLGITSGCIVSIICLTGAVWALHIHGWLGEGDPPIPSCPPAAILPPSTLAAIAKDSLNGRLPSYITYTKDRPAWLGVFARGSRTMLMIDPCSGRILKRTSLSMNAAADQPFDLWLFVRRGHQSLWLPRAVGRPIINYSTLAFVIVLLSGIFLWIPKTKKATRHRLLPKWKKGTGITRKIFDFHAVAGIYISLLLLLMALTGMMWGLEWYAKAIHRIAGVNSDIQARTEQSDTTRLALPSPLDPMQAADSVFRNMQRRYPHAASFYINCPDPADPASVVRATVYPEAGIYYNRDVYAFDRYSLREITPAGIYGGLYRDAPPSARLLRSIYDLHTGSYWGLPGRILYTIAALLGATFPFTGAYMWYKRRKKKYTGTSESNDKR
ncbi:MAG: PepSY domain-containing protein [Tannerella sp.]|jgi:uncharacterized iron-regulated membrane protein|nr:PepSY domain-containing protein [Tannerella sp.]